MKRYILSLNLLMISLFNCYGQCEKVVYGGGPEWYVVCEKPIPANTEFQITASGVVNFGGWGNKDSPEAGVTGSSILPWLDKHKGDIWAAAKWGISILSTNTETSQDPSEPTGSGQDPSAASGEKPYSLKRFRLPMAQPAWSLYINQNAKQCNYDEGGFWVAITTNNLPPSDANTICAPALYYWYSQMNNSKIPIFYYKPVWVWTRMHDGGRDAYNSKTSSYGDNKGYYRYSIKLKN